MQSAGNMMDLLAAQQAQSGVPPAQAAPAEAVPAEDDGAGGRGRKRVASSRPQDERLAAVQEKNRKAQKRFRERQKEKMSSMEAQLAAKDKEITTLREESSSLAGRNAVLEKVLALREEQLKSFQPGAAGEVNQGAALAALAYAPLSAAGAPASSGLLVLPPASAQVPLSLPQAAGLVTGGSGGAARGVDNQATAALTGYVRDLTQLTEEKVTAASERRLAEVALNAAQQTARSAPYLPEGKKEPVSGSVDPHRWQSVAANLGASPKQRAEVREMRAAHHARIANLQAARQQVTANVTAGVKANNNLQMESATAELQQSLQQEAEANVEFLHNIYTKVLSPKQFGKAVVHSYPFYVDGTQLVELLASDAQLQPGINLTSLPQATAALFAQQGVAMGGSLVGQLSAIPAIGGFTAGGSSTAPAPAEVKPAGAI